jgi:hypothetical protein
VIAAVRWVRVSVIAAFSDVDDPVTTDFDLLAVTATAVARNRIAVVARLAGIEYAVAAQPGAARPTSARPSGAESRLARGSVREAIARGDITGRCTPTGRADVSERAR